MVNDAASSEESQVASNKPLVLVVDDDETHLRLMELLAEELGITARVASSCADAVDILAKVAFDLILMDYRMPHVDGCSCARRVRTMKEYANGITIICVTAHAADGVEEQCRDAGMDDFLAKPFTVEQLNKKLRYWLAKEK